MTERKSTFKKRRAEQQKYRDVQAQREVVQELAPSAIHEAGHAVIDELFLDGVEYVTIERELLRNHLTKDGVSYDAISSGFTQPRCEHRSLQTVGDFERECLHIFAGPLAEYILTGCENSESMAGDGAQMHAYANHLGIAEEQVSSIAEKTTTRLHQLFSDDRVLKALKDVAALLLVKKRISGEEVHEIVEASGAQSFLKRIHHLHGCTAAYLSVHAKRVAFLNCLATARQRRG